MISKKQLKELLNTNGQLKEGDIFLIDEFYHNMKMMKDAKTHINDKGILAQGDKDGKIFYQSPAIKIYNDSFSNLLKISQKLGLSPYDRGKILAEVKGTVDDGFDD